MAQESQQPPRPRPRIEGLSDMIFGLALSVGAISLVGNPPTTSSELYNDILTFGFSFLILIAVWMRYTKIMSVLPLEDSKVTALNILLLFTVSIEPFLFNLFQQTSKTLEPTSGYYNVVTIAYGTNLGILFLALGFFTSLLLDDQKKLIPKEFQKEFTYDAAALFLAGALFILSGAIPITQTGILLPLRFDLWIIPFLLLRITRRGTGAYKEVQKLRTRK